MKLNKKHMQAIKMPIEGHRHEKIAETCKISLATLYNWENDADFAAELEKQRQLSMDNARDILSNAIEKASFTLVGLLDSHTDSVRLKAAKEVLDRYFGSPTQVQQINAEVKQEMSLDAEAALQDEGTRLLLRQLHSRINENE